MGTHTIERIAGLIGAPVVALGLTASVAFMAGPDLVRLDLERESSIRLRGTATLSSWTCEAPEPEAAIPAHALAGAEGARIGVGVGEIDCGNGIMNGRMRDALGAERHPRITFVLDRLQVSPTEGGRLAGTASGRLTLAGVEREVALEARAGWTGDVIRMTGRTELRMSDFEVERPRVLFGFVRADDRVEVEWDLAVASTELEAALGDRRMALLRDWLQ